MRAEEVMQEVAKLCRSFHAKEVILYGSRAKGTAMERSDIDIAVSGVDNFESLVEKVEELPTLFSVDLVNMDTCRNRLLFEYFRQYGREIYQTVFIFLQFTGCIVGGKAESSFAFFCVKLNQCNV